MPARASSKKKSVVLYTVFVGGTKKLSIHSLHSRHEMAQVKIVGRHPTLDRKGEIGLLEEPRHLFRTGIFICRETPDRWPQKVKAHGKRVMREKIRKYMRIESVPPQNRQCVVDREARLRWQPCWRTSGWPQRCRPSAWSPILPPGTRWSPCPPGGRNSLVLPDYKPK